MTSQTLNRRILVIDDNRAIQADFRMVLAQPDENASLREARASLFDDDALAPPPERFEVDYADQGQTGFAMVREALQRNQPYAVAFVDMRMPPGWDGGETIEHIWQVDPDIQIVICTAYSDHSWETIIERLKHSEKLLILRKPFDSIEVWQLANSLTQRWHFAQQAKRQLDELVALQEERAADEEKAIHHLELQAALGNGSADHESHKKTLP